MTDPPAAAVVLQLLPALLSTLLLTWMMASEAVGRTARAAWIGGRLPPPPPTGKSGWRCRSFGSQSDYRVRYVYK